MKASDPFNVSICGFGIRTREAQNVAGFWASLAGKHFGHENGREEASALELINEALEDAGLDPGPQDVRLGVFSAAPSGANDLQGALQQRFGSVLIESLGKFGGVYALVRAADALARDACDLAITIQVHDDIESRAAGSIAVLMARPEIVTSRTYAKVRGAVSRSPLETEADLLLDVCNASKTELRSITLLDLADCDNATMALDLLRARLSDGSRRLPHCTIGPYYGSPEGAFGLYSFCALALSLYQRLLPPIQTDNPRGILNPFCADPSVRPWIESKERRAVVICREASGAGSAILLAEPDWETDAEPARLDRSWPSELITVSGRDRAEMLDRLHQLQTSIEANPGRKLSDLALAHRDKARGQDCRASIVVSDTAELAAKTRRLLDKLDSTDSPALTMPDGVYFRHRTGERAKTAILMPGQGSQYLGMLGDLCLHLPELQVWFERLEGTCEDLEPCPPALIIAPPRIGLTEEDKRRQQKRLFDISGGAMISLTASLGLYKLISDAGVRTDAMAGYSNGENAALIASGTWQFPSKDAVFSSLTRVRQSEAFENSDVAVPRGESIAVNKASRQVLREVLTEFEGNVYLALDNCPDQVVLFGDPAHIKMAADRLRGAGAICMPLPFDRGHHTPVYMVRAHALRAMYQQFGFAQVGVPVYSCAIAAPFPETADEIRELAVSQWTNCVRFRDTVERLYSDGIRTFVEVGPNSRLTGFVHSTLRGRPHTAIASNIQGRPALDQLLHLLGALFVEGHDIDVRALRRNPEEFSTRAPSAANRNSEHDGDNSRVPEAAVSHSTAGILSAHFELMQEFLKAQERTHALLANALNAGSQRTPPPQSAGSALMIGDCVEVIGNARTTRRTFHVDSDLFLRHHTFGRIQCDPIDEVHGLPVMPFTFSMEIVAEAACCLTGHSSPFLGLWNLRASRWLAADNDQIVIDIQARNPKAGDRDDGVFVSVFERTSSGQMLAFEGVADFIQDRIPESLPPVRARRKPGLSAEEFNNHLFHGPLLKSMRTVLAIDGDFVEIEAVVPFSSGLFANNINPAFRLPAPLLDAAGQLVAYWLMEQGHDVLGLFPIHLEQYRQFVPPPKPGSVVILRGRVGVSGRTTNATVDLIDGAGALLGRLDGLRMRIYGSSDVYLRYLLGGDPDARLSVAEKIEQGRYRYRMPLPGVDFREAHGIWTRLLARRILSKTERQTWAALAESERLPWLLTRAAAKEAVIDCGNFEGVRLSDLDTELENACVIVSGNKLWAEEAPKVRIEQRGDEISAVLETQVHNDAEASEVFV